MDLTGERWKLGLLLHTHNEQKNRCTYNRCCMMNVSVMQRRFLFAAQVFVDDTQPILAAHWVYCRKMFLQPQQRLCLSHVIANHRLATAETLQSFACHCEPVGCCADTLPPSACHCEERGGCTATWQSVPLRQHKTESNTLGKSVTGCEFAPSAISSHHFLRGSGLSRRFAPRNDKGGRCHRAPRPCSRRRAAAFCMSLRTSAHTGVAIRFPRREAWQVSST